MNKKERLENSEELPSHPTSQSSSSHALKRYNLVLPENLHAKLQEVAEQRHTTLLELIKKFIKLGLLIDSLDEDTTIILRKDDKEREILIF